VKKSISMKRFIGLMPLLLLAGVCAAEDDAPAAAPPAAVAAVAPITSSLAPTNTSPAASDGKDSVRYVTEARWAVAGYNNEEIVYTILITNQDSRILRCTTELRGAYYENGKKFDIADRQSSTVFPDQQVQVGNWLGMDQKSGATYSVKCHAI
jgi:hypothetical protein